MQTLCYQDPPLTRGWEYKSALTLFGLPFLHVSFKIIGRRPVVARGIIAVGQFACGFLAVGQFTVGAISLGQFTCGVLAAGQFALAYSLYSWFGLYLHQGHGRLVRNLLHLVTRSS